MRIEFFKGRQWLATVSLAAALAVAGFSGLQAATPENSPSENPAPTIMMARAPGRPPSALLALQTKDDPVLLLVDRNGTTMFRAV
jgi:hypothetical protein